MIVFDFFPYFALAAILILLCLVVVNPALFGGGPAFEDLLPTEGAKPKSSQGDARA